MDLLSTVLQSMRFTDSLISLFEFEPPWAFRLSVTTPDQVVVFGPEHAPLRIEVDGEPAVVISPGDTAVVIGAPVTVASLQASPPLSFEELWDAHGLPRLGQDTSRREPILVRWPRAQGAQPKGDTILSMAVQLIDVQHSVLNVLPRCLVLRGSNNAVFPWFAPMRHFIAHEGGRRQPGYEAAARALARLALIDFIRTYALEIGVERASWLKGVTDPHIGRALSLMHGDPCHAWQLAALAEACGLPRSTFSRRFLQRVGRPPMAYLGDLRLQLAADRLIGGERVGDVAAAIGYQSEWAFRQAFSRQFHTSPTRYVRAHRREPGRAGPV